MAAVMMYEKSVRKQIVAPLLQEMYGALATKEAAFAVTDFLIRLNPKRMQESTRFLAQKLTQHFGTDERNSAVAHGLLLSTFHDDDM